jgi:hypothetical protein
MRPPRFRIRTPLIAVAVAALVSGVEVMRCRRACCQGRASGHALAAMTSTPGSFGDRPDQAKAAFHDAMRVRYEHAAARPWLPVPPDQPEPR